MVQIILVHSMLRWLIAIMAISTVTKLALGCVGFTEHSRLDRKLAAAFAGVMDFQFLLGLILLAEKLMVYGFAGVTHVIPHTVNMLFAVIAAHMASRWSKYPDKLLRTLVAMSMSLLLLVAGVQELPQGWFG